MGPGRRRDGNFFISVAPGSAAPDAAAGAAGLLLCAAQALGRVSGGVAGAVEEDRLAEIVVAEPAVIGAALGRLAGDLAAGDVAGELVGRGAALAGNSVEMDERAVEQQRRRI